MGFQLLVVSFLLTDVSSVPLQQSLRHLDTAYSRFFNFDFPSWWDAWINGFVIPALDLHEFVTGSRTDLPAARPLLYGTLPPPDVLAGLASGSEIFRELPEGVLSRLAAASQEGAASGMSPAIGEALRRGFTELLDAARLQVRERLQLWHCLRHLGVAVEGTDASRLLGVVLEIPDHDGLLLGIYADGSAIGVHSGGGFRWQAYDEGEASGLVATVLEESLLSAMRLELGLVCPLPPPKGFFLVSFLYPAGIRSVVVSNQDLPGSQHKPLYDAGLVLWDTCTGRRGQLPFDLDSGLEFGGEFSRSVAALLDVVVFGLVLGGIGWLCRHAVSTWPPVGVAMLCYSSLLIPPVISAWMESSPAWGFRTLGKQALGLSVVGVSTGQGPGFLQALARNLSKWFVSPLFFSCGFLWARFHKYHCCWHDVLADTVVLRNYVAEDEIEIAAPAPEGRD